MLFYRIRAPTTPNELPSQHSGTGNDVESVEIPPPQRRSPNESVENLSLWTLRAMALFFLIVGAVVWTASRAYENDRYEQDCRLWQRQRLEYETDVKMWEKMWHERALQVDDWVRELEEQEEARRRFRRERDEHAVRVIEWEREAVSHERE